MCPSSHQFLICHFFCFLFPDNNLSKYPWIFTKLGMCIDIMEIWFGVGNVQISLIFNSYLPATQQYFHFWMITFKWIFTKLCMCSDIMEIRFATANVQISSIFNRVICLPYYSGGYYSFTFFLFLYLPVMLNNFSIKVSFS